MATATHIFLLKLIYFLFNFIFSFFHFYNNQTIKQELKHCPGGASCLEGRTSKLCHKCAERFFTVGGDCIACPENDFAQYITMFVVFASACALLYYLLAAVSLILVFLNFNTAAVDTY